MNFNEYQKLSRKTAIYPSAGSNWTYPVLGLSGEAGEVAEKFKKIIRDSNGIVTEEHKASIQKELGDVLWYVAQIASELDLDLDAIAAKNIEKLYSRLERGVIQGSGDNR